MYFIVGSAVSSFDQHFVAARGQFSQGQNYKFMRLLKDISSSLIQAKSFVYLR